MSILKQIAIDRAKQHELQLSERLKAHSIERKDCVKLFLTKPADLPPDVLKEFYYLDAYAKLVNADNYTPVDRADYRPKDYIDTLYTAVYNWATTKGDSFLAEIRQNGMLKQMEVADEDIFKSILFAAAYREQRLHDAETEARARNIPRLEHSADRGPEPPAAA